MVDDIKFNAIYIVESLPPGEVQTGRILHDYVCAQLADRTLPVVSFHSNCSGVDSFREIVADLQNAVTTQGLLPILHIEAHGSLDQGLYFADDSTLSWIDFCSLITPLNHATGFRLVVAIAACYGADLISGVRLSIAAPCFAFIAPSDEIHPGEVINRFQILYREMFLTLDAHRTFLAVKQEKMERGGMIILTAQYWFDELIARYLEANATRKSVKDFALRSYRTIQSSGGIADMRSLKRSFKTKLPAVVKEYFQSYFMLKEIPGNRERFAPLWLEIEKKLHVALRKCP